MNPPEQHYRKLIESIREQHVAPPNRLRENFLNARPVRRNQLVQLKRWSIAASLALVVMAAWLSVQRSGENVLLFTEDIVVEQFRDQDIHVAPVYRLDANFTYLKQWYHELGM